MATLLSGSGAVWCQAPITVQHDAADRVQRLQWNAQRSQNFTYDAAGNLLRKQSTSLVQPPGVWWGWNGVNFSRDEVIETAEVITKATANWGTLRIRLARPVDGNNFRIEVRAKCDPAMGCVPAYDLGLQIDNSFLSGQFDGRGNEVPSRWAIFAMTNGYFPDFFTVMSDAGYSDWLRQPGRLNTLDWHDYALETQGQEIRLYYDGALIYTQVFSGTIGPLDNFEIGGKVQIQVAPGSFRVVR